MFLCSGKRGRDFQNKQLRVGRDQHGNAILLPYNPYFPGASILLCFGAIASQSNAAVNKNICCF